MGPGVGVERSLSDKLVRESLFKDMTFELRPEGWEVNDMDSWTKRIPGRGKSKYKDPEMRWVWYV